MEISSKNFGIYHIEFGEVDDKIVIDSVTNKFVNNLIVGAFDYERVLKTVKLASANNCKVWIYLNYSLWTESTNNSYTLIDNWEEEFSHIHNLCKVSGAGDSVMGYFIEEPQIYGFTEYDVLQVSKYCKEILKKRLMITFCASEIDNKIHSHKRNLNVIPITQELLQYATDLSFVHYVEFNNNRNQFIHLRNKLLEMSSNNAKIWYTACIMKKNEDFTEENAIENLRGCYLLYKSDERAGGLMCYSWIGESLPGYKNKKNIAKKEDWRKVINELTDISNEIVKCDISD